MNLKSSNAAFLTFQEVSGPRERSRSVRRIIEGEGKLTPSTTFVWRGDTYEAGTCRVTPDHEVTRSEFAHLLVPAYAKESGHAVLDFLETTRGRRGQRRASIFPKRNSRQSPHDYWRLGPPRWRLGRC
jgi:hypothetical protein